jgi:hypothetical protein
VAEGDEGTCLDFDECADTIGMSNPGYCLSYSGNIQCCTFGLQPVYDTISEKGLDFLTDLEGTYSTFQTDSIGFKKIGI